MEKRLLSIKEVGAYLSISPRTIYNQLSQGIFPIKHKKIGRLVRFDRMEVDRYLSRLPDSY